METRFTPEKIQQVLEKFKECIDSGDSIHLSRRKACGKVDNYLAKEMMLTEDYLNILNAYLKAKGCNMVYRREETKIVSVKPKVFTPPNPAIKPLARGNK